MECFHCRSAIELSSGARVEFRATCDTCDSDLHVCCNCEHHDPSAYNECRESSAERVNERQRANRCEYFRPSQRAGSVGEGGNAARAALEELFKK